MIADTHLLEALAVAVYTTDPEGRLTFYNDAAAELWGCRPELGVAQWCGSWRLYWPDGRPLPHDQCPMAVTLREGRAVRGVEAVAERPDGTRVAFLPFPTPLKDASGRVTGAINVLVDVAAREHDAIQTARLAAIVASSEDAIVSKTLDGLITSWNAAATRIFGYEPHEILGRPIKLLIPPELHPDEDRIIAKLTRGERVEHYDTVRIAKDGRRMDISLTVSPIYDKSGKVIGASKVARDVTERKRNDDLQRLLFDELNHRVKNTLAMIQAIASQSLRRAASPREFVVSFNGRVQALARAHDLLVQGKMKGAGLIELVREQVVLGTPDAGRVSCSGPFVMLEPRAAVQVALVLHELATNARKHGALSVPSGRLSIHWSMQMDAERALHLQWAESGVPNVTAPAAHGFGTTLIERTLQANGGEAAIRYGADGVVCDIRLPLPEEATPNAALLASATGDEAHPAGAERPGPALRGKRILIIEDEPLVALEIESHLEAAGCMVVGPAGTLAAAHRLVAEAAFDAALLDANLAGHPVDVLAAALTQKGAPFAFATGYGREALPAAHQGAPVLTKPFDPGQLLAVVADLVAGDRPSHVLPLRKPRP